MKFIQVILVIAFGLLLIVWVVKIWSVSWQSKWIISSVTGLLLKSLGDILFSYKIIQNIGQLYVPSLMRLF